MLWNRTPRELPDHLRDREAFLSRLFDLARACIRSGYFSFDVEGIEHVPKKGRVVYAHNHAGWFALDAFFITLAIAEERGLRRAPFFATHEAALAAPVVGSLMRRFGALPASWFRRPERLPPEIESVGNLPEGVRGNTKPFWQAYQMRDWNRGFVRVAIAREAPVVPVAVFGGEECLPVAWSIRFLEPLIGASIGLPLTLMPLPARWRVVFHEPVQVAGKGALTDQQFCTEAARSVQRVVQATLDRGAAQRPLGRLALAVSSLRR